MKEFFKLEALGTNVRTEILAGLTMVLTMAYIVAVSLAVFSAAGVAFDHIIKAIPAPLEFGITAGIGLFIAFLGLQQSGLVIANEETLVSFGDVRDPGTALAIAGLFITLILIARKVKGALFIGMFITAVLG